MRWDTRTLLKQSRVLMLLAMKQDAVKEGEKMKQNNMRLRVLLEWAKSFDSIQRSGKGEEKEEYIVCPVSVERNGRKEAERTIRKTRRLLLGSELKALTASCKRANKLRVPPVSSFFPLVSLSSFFSSFLSLCPSFLFSFSHYKGCIVFCCSMGE